MSNTALLLSLTQATGTAGGSSGTPWWQVATGIIAVPAALLGLMLTWSLIKKARLETTKTEMEIREKEQALASQPADERFGQTAAEVIAEPILEGRRVQSLMLRFIVIFIVFTIWSLVRDVFDIIYGTTLMGLQASLGDSEESAGIIILWFAVQSIRAVPQIGYWWIIVGLGWPVLLDSLRLLHIQVPAWLTSRSMQSTLLLAAVLVPIGKILQEAWGFYL